MSRPTASLGPEHPYSAVFGTTVGKLQLALGRAQDAVATLTATHAALFANDQRSPIWRGEAAFFLSRARLEHDPSRRSKGSCAGAACKGSKAAEPGARSRSSAGTTCANGADSVEEAYVDSERMSWIKNVFNGGHGERETVCGGSCYLAP